MLFLIDYERQRGRIVSLRAYPDRQRHDAEESRLALELELGRTGVEREVVLLQAANEAALRKTHRRYFENWDQLASSKTG